MDRAAITQKHGTGCAVACVAFVLNVSYDRALAYFAKPDRAWTTGFYCKDIVAAMSQAGRAYTFAPCRDTMMFPQDSIVFVEAAAYPLGHYLAFEGSGWMDPWLNHPVIAPARSGFRTLLSVQPRYCVHPLV